MTFGGWVKTGREQGAGAFAFLEVNDGSTFANLQVWISGTSPACSNIMDTWFDKCLAEVSTYALHASPVDIADMIELLCFLSHSWHRTLAFYFMSTCRS